MSCAFSEAKLISPLSTSVNCAGKLSLVSRVVCGIEVRYWTCEAHAAEDGRDSSDVYNEWKKLDQID